MMRCSYHVTVTGGKAHAGPHDPVLFEFHHIRTGSPKRPPLLTDFPVCRAVCPGGLWCRSERNESHLSALSGTRTPRLLSRKHFPGSSSSFRPAFCLHGKEGLRMGEQRPEPEDGPSKHPHCARHPPEEAVTRHRTSVRVYVRKTVIICN